MRSAPFGLTGFPARVAFELAARCARLTHGHPTGCHAAGALAALTARLLVGASLADAIRSTLDLLVRYPGGDDTSRALGGAVDLAAAGDPTPERVELLGRGWGAEEALAIAAYCALAGHGRTPGRSALLLAVNHSGDSDSIGAICGNLLGAAHGDMSLPPDWLARVEGRGTISELADDFCAEFHPSQVLGQDELILPPERYPPG